MSVRVVSQRRPLRDFPFHGLGRAHGWVTPRTGTLVVRPIRGSRPTRARSARASLPSPPRQNWKSVYNLMSAGRPGLRKPRVAFDQPQRLQVLRLPDGKYIADDLRLQRRPSPTKQAGPGQPRALTPRRLSSSVHAEQRGSTNVEIKRRRRWRASHRTTQQRPVYLPRRHP